MPDWLDLSTPLTDAAVRALHAGNLVRLSGTIFTARDAVHHFLAHGGEPPCDLRGAVIYHCGPVIVADPATGRWRVTAAGPTTSIREEPYLPGLIERFGLRMIIGKGGMGAATLDACRRCGCVYCQATGGAAQVLADAITEVRNVHLKERFGAPEAIWELAVTALPLTVTMDTHGGNLHAAVAAASAKALAELLQS
ncbi:MAG: FumA C-terminus/TtdB family hydratase beta subunit [Lentisphaeria bacterium]|jgi:fumarate hydratase class I